MYIESKQKPSTIESIIEKRIHTFRDKRTITLEQPESPTGSKQNFLPQAENTETPPPVSKLNFIVRAQGATIRAIPGKGAPSVPLCLSLPKKKRSCLLKNGVWNAIFSGRTIY